MKIQLRLFPILSCMVPFFALSQNIGIGTTTPADRLTVRSASGGLGITQETADGTVRIGFYTTPSAGAYLQTHTNHDLLFATNNGVAQMVLQKGTGNVGIGTNTPDVGGLVVNRKVGAVHAVFGGNTSGVAIESNFPGFGLNSYFSGSRKMLANGYAGYVGLNPTNGDLIFANSSLVGTAGNDNPVFNRMIIDKDGNVGIGTNNPTAKLDVNGSIRIANGTQANGRQLISDESGMATWRSGAFGAVSVRTPSGTGGEKISFTPNNFTKISPIQVVTDVSNAFDATNATYTVPENGYYRVSYYCPLRAGTPLTGSNCFFAFLYQATIRRGSSRVATQSGVYRNACNDDFYVQHASIDVILLLSAGEVLSFGFENAEGSGNPFATIPAEIVLDARMMINIVKL